MSHLSTAQIAEMARLTRRQVQRILGRGFPDFGAVRTGGGHWMVPDSPAIRRWARKHRRWAGRGDARKSRMNPQDKAKGIVTIEGILQKFLFWHRCMKDQIEGFDLKRLEKLESFLAPQARLHAEVIQKIENLKRGEFRHRSR